MNNLSTHGSSSRTSSSTASSSLRPRAPRLISGLDEGDEVDFDPTNAPPRRIVSPIGTPYESRSVSPLPSKHPSRSPSAYRERSNARFQTGGGSLKPNGNGSQTSLVSLWGTSWTAIQGIASDLLGNEDEPAPRGTRRRKNSRAGLGKPVASGTRSWGPSVALPLPATNRVATGTREERESLVRAQKRKDLLLGTDAHQTDSLGRFKRRTSDELASASAPPGVNEDRDALVYIHHVKPEDTLAGITIRYNCSAQTLRKANRMWANDRVQTKKTLVLPIDGCAVKGRVIPAPETIDLLSSSADDSSRVAQAVGGPQSESSRNGVRARNESISTQSDRPTSSALSTISEVDPPWTHDSWVMFPNATQPTEIARLSRRALAYFPPARRKSQSFSDLDTPSTSLDLNRSTFFDPTTTSPVGQDPPQRPRRPRTLSNATNGYFPSYLAGPGGVGTMNKNVKSPGPAQDGLNKLFAGRLPNVAPPANQQALYMPDVPLYSDDPSRVTTPIGTGAQTPNMNLEQMGASVETWFRKVASKAQSALEPVDKRDPAKTSAGVSGRGGGGIGDLIEMADSFAIGGEDEDEVEQERGRPAASSLMGPPSTSSAYLGLDRVQHRGRGGTSSASAKRAKDD